MTPQYSPQNVVAFSIDGVPFLGRCIALTVAKDYEGGHLFGECYVLTEQAPKIQRIDISCDLSRFASSPYAAQFDVAFVRGEAVGAAISVVAERRMREFEATKNTAIFATPVAAREISGGLLVCCTELSPFLNEIGTIIGQTRSDDLRDWLTIVRAIRRQVTIEHQPNVS